MRIMSRLGTEEGVRNGRILGRFCSGRDLQSYQIGEGGSQRKRGLKDAAKFGASAPGRTELPLAGSRGQRKGRLGDAQGLGCSGVSGRCPRTSRWDVREAVVQGTVAVQSRELPPEGKRTPSHSQLRGAREGPALQHLRAPGAYSSLPGCEMGAA